METSGSLGSQALGITLELHQFSLGSPADQLQKVGPHSFHIM